MFKKFFNKVTLKFLSMLLIVLTFIAYANVALATNVIGYQPEVPKNLLKD